MQAVIDLVLIPLTVAIIGGAIAGPWGVFFGLVVGLTIGAANGQSRSRRSDVEALEREVSEKDRRIDELERRIGELEDE